MSDESDIDDVSFAIKQGYGEPVDVLSKTRRKYEMLAAKDARAAIAAAWAEGREHGLREAARQCVTHERGTPMHSPPQLLTEAHDAILALIPKKTP